MGAPQLSLEQAQDAVFRVEERLKAGDRPQGMAGPGRSAVETAAEQMIREGLIGSNSTFQARIRVARDRYGLAPDEALYRAKQYRHKSPGAPVIPSQDHVVEDEPEGDPIRVAVIGDAHDSPHLPNKERFRWLGQYIAERGIERVISVGDWWTMDCFSSHTDRATFEGFAKPTFEQDRDSFHASQRAFQEGLAGHRPKKHICLGNHELRAWRYDNHHPDGLSHGQMVEEAFMQWGWSTSPYGEYRFFGGVGFVHVPLNGLGKPLAYGQRPNKALVDTVHGDDHRATQMSDHKSGPFRSPTIYSAATALPPGHIEGYARLGGSTWRSGICEATVWGGHVRAWAFTEMVLLRKSYAVRAAA